MNRIEVEILKPQAGLDGFADTWRQVAQGEQITPRLAFGSLHELFAVITEKRLELLRYVAENEGLNTRQIAGQLGRNYKNVYTDVVELVTFGLLVKDDRGGLSAPFDEIVIHAGIRNVA